MQVDQWMNRDLVTVGPDDSFRTAMHLIRQKGIRHLPVVEGKRLVGIVTETDILQAFLRLRGKGPLDIAASIVAIEREKRAP